MAKSLVNCRDVVRDFLDETTASDWTNVELNRLINVYYHKVYSAVIDVFENYAPLTRANLTTVADTQEYALASDFLKMRRVEINYDVANANSAPLRALPVNMDAVRRDLGNQNVGITVLRNPVYYLRGNNVGFLPIPDRAGTNAITYWYSPLQADLSADADTVTLPYPDRDFMLIAYGATADALRFGQQEDAIADKFDRKFKDGVEMMQAGLEDRVEEEGKYVIDVVGDSPSFGEASY